MKFEKDKCHFSFEGDVIVVRDECLEEVARYGAMGDVLSHFPGLDQKELAMVGVLIGIMGEHNIRGKVFGCEFTAVK